MLALLIGHPGFGEAHRKWKCSDLSLWIEWLRKSALKPGVTHVISTLPRQREVTPEILRDTLQSEELEGLIAALNKSPQALLEWWRDRLAADYRRRTRFPATIAALRGSEALCTVPQVVVGTIHSVKGSQADVVYLFPDLSKGAEAQYTQHGTPRDSVIRVFYVGATRAREVLYICSGDSRMAVSI
jgi:superfamily I DNA/RNA helicase